MSLNALRQARRKRPFQPFDIRLADGRALPVKHPEFVAVGNRLAVVIDDDSSRSVVEPHTAVSIDFDALSSNG